MGEYPLKVGAVCVYHNLVPVAVEALRGSDIPVAAVSTGFPAGQNPFEQKIGRDRGIGQSGCGGDRYRYFARACVDRQLAGTCMTRCELSVPPVAMRI